MFYYIFLFCLIYGLWDGYEKMQKNKSISCSKEPTKENYSGLLDFLTSNK